MPELEANKPFAYCPTFVAVAIAAFSLLLPALVPAAYRSNADDIFHSTNLLRIAIDIPEEGVQTLRRSTTARSSAGKPNVRAGVSEGNRVYPNVSVQLKGFTTFRSIDRLPSLTLDFNKLAPKQKFHGLTKISLNNSLQDSTRLHEKFSRELFAAAGVPVPRADYALVTLNGRDLGLYVLTEGFDKEFLKRHFDRADGTLYEGGILKDIDQPLQIGSGRSATNAAAVQRLIAASCEPDAGKRLRALEAALDLEKFLSMMAVETILCHSDSYSMNRNNYRIYHDPVSDKLVFMPHGMDRVLGTHRSPLQLEAVPPALGLVARALLSTREGRARYVERAEFLFTNLFDPDRLCRRVHEIDARIIAAKTNSVVAAARFDDRLSKNPQDDADNLCDRIATRAAELRLQFTNRADLLAAPPVPTFDSNGVASLEQWKPKRRLGQPEVVWEMDVRDGKPMWRVSAPDAPDESFTVSLANKIALPAGSYRLSGEINLAGEGATNFVRTYVIRQSGTRYAIEQQQLNWRRINFGFQVVEPRAPAGIEVICDIRAAAPEFWFDARSLRLIREQKRE